jgi:hypothetical protein
VAQRRIVVRPRAQQGVTAWEIWTFKLLMEIGVGTGNWEWVGFDSITCPAGTFLREFKQLGIPGFPVWDASNGCMRRERTYLGRNFPVSA